METQTGEVSHQSSADCCKLIPSICSSIPPQFTSNITGFGAFQWPGQLQVPWAKPCFLLSGIVKTPILLFSFMELVGFSTLKRRKHPQPWPVLTRTFKISPGFVCLFKLPSKALI